MADPDPSDVLTAPLVLEYPYTRTVGDVMGRFFTSLRDGRIEGIRGSDGRVICPPTEYDPVTSETLSEFVEVGPGGEVTTWTWVAEALADTPLDRPFAWALIRLDGADTAMLHAVDAGSEANMATGMRVRAQWRATTEGGIRDIECFVPAASETEKG
jgi:uncharacterized OB-fold protein